MSALDDLAGVMAGVLNGPKDGTPITRRMAAAVFAAGYSKPRTIGYAVLDRAGHMIGEQFTERTAAAEFAAEWTKDCEDAGIDWDYRVATIVQDAA